MSEKRFLFSRRWVLAGLLAGASDVALAAPPAVSLRPRPRPAGGGTLVWTSAETLVDRAKLGESAKVGFVVADAASGEVLEVMNPLLPQPPASTAKALTALYALDTLGDAHVFQTQVVGTGPVESGVLKGDLVLVGSGDPTLDTTRLATLAANLADSGITAVDGDFLTWDGALPSLNAIDPDQPDQVGYNPAISGLNLNFNRVHFEWRRAGGGWSTTMQARTAKYRPDVSVARMSVEKRRYPIYTYADGGDVDIWTVASGALGNEGSRWLPVRKPTAYTADVFRSLARSKGISLGAPVFSAIAPQGVVLAEVSSASMRDVLQGMLKYSTNITAEAVGLSCSATLAGAPEPLAQSATRMSEWIGANVGSPHPALVDHSGLGGNSRVCARDMVRALVKLGPEVDLEPILKPVTMKNNKGQPVQNHPVKIRAKTGTLNFVSALAGFVTLPNGRKLAFATFVADVPRRDAIPREQRERPEGVRGWTGRARMLQIRLIERWSKLYV